MLQWLENIWNLRKIFDKYLPMVRLLYERIPAIWNELDELREEVRKLKETSVQTVDELPEVPELIEVTETR